MSKLVKMLKTHYLTVLLLVTFASGEEYYNIRSQRFCITPCQNGEHPKPNLACNCEEVEGIPGLEYVKDNNVEFREAVLHAFNSFRNKFAKGLKLGQEDLQPSSNMVVLNYDVGLEYLAYCILKRGQISGSPLLCVRDNNNAFAQGFKTHLSQSTKNPPNIRNVETAIEYLNKHFEEFENRITVDDFHSLNGKFLRFGYPLAALNGRVGCVRQLFPNATSGRDTVAIYCSFGNIRDGVWNVGTTLTSSGEPCSSCPYSSDFDLERYDGCNSKYTALCGKSVPVPKYSWKYGADPNQPFAHSNSPKSISDLKMPLYATVLTLIFFK